MSAPAAVPEIAVDRLAEQLPGGVRIVDVREVNEYVAGHVPGAVLVPLGTVPDRLDAFDGDGPVYVVCRSGARSGRACEYLRQYGYDAINVAGGTLAWIDAGHAVVEGDSPT
jgi:rhodanese-related sulfurtransferase